MPKTSVEMKDLPQVIPTDELELESEDEPHIEGKKDQSDSMNKVMINSMSKTIKKNPKPKTKIKHTADKKNITPRKKVPSTEEPSKVADDLTSNDELEVEQVKEERSEDEESKDGAAFHDFYY